MHKSSCDSSTYIQMTYTRHSARRFVATTSRHSTVRSRPARRVRNISRHKGSTRPRSKNKNVHKKGLWAPRLAARAPRLPPVPCGRNADTHNSPKGVEIGLHAWLQALRLHTCAISFRCLRGGGSRATVDPQWDAPRFLRFLRGFAVVIGTVARLQARVPSDQTG